MNSLLRRPAPLSTSSLLPTRILSSTLTPATSAACSPGTASNAAIKAARRTLVDVIIVCLLHRSFVGSVVYRQCKPYVPPRYARCHVHPSVRPDTSAQAPDIWSIQPESQRLPRHSTQNR